MTFIVQQRNGVGSLKCPGLVKIQNGGCVNGPIDVTHQTDEDEDELDDICVGYRVEPPQQCVDYGHH